MLPKPGIYYFPWEVSAGQVPDGGALRTFGRLCLYDMTQSRMTLRAQHGSDEHQILVCTKLVEPFQAQIDSLYLVLGELEHQGKLVDLFIYLSFSQSINQSINHMSFPLWVLGLPSDATGVPPWV
uniref:TEN1 subunit of CST complex n=1 Tax=Canis lupus familiaris TaxID=9615 RepID=A0A8P0PQY0_CANLF